MSEILLDEESSDNWQQWIISLDHTVKAIPTLQSYKNP